MTPAPGSRLGGNLLDHSIVLYGSAMGDGNQLNHDPLPVVLVGRRFRKTEGRKSHPQHAQDYDVEPVACRFGQAGYPSGEIRRQHGHDGDLAIAQHGRRDDRAPSDSNPRPTTFLWSCSSRPAPLRRRVLEPSSFPQGVAEELQPSIGYRCHR
jgi:hypothetical protein